MHDSNVLNVQTYEFDMIFIISLSHAKIVLYVFFISLKFWNDTSITSC
jgi:hypothetical protein